ncbi:unnamed protein product [Adineta ricciae]|uniref:1-phosphatidylinositol 4,5-bisphosphate phosphodiesterase n=1 Tax=Adineta ricciae TaxID=249248 RepID=A0A815R418_ADIRI|nr:unnamed protein product [Adineta ricciae]
MSATTSHVSTLKFNEIPVEFQNGVAAFKWPEDNKKPLKPIEVKLSIDAKGFYLICVYQQTEVSPNKTIQKVECFDLALIHDTRTGSQVTIPPEAKNCPELKLHLLDGWFATKWLTLSYGNTFVPSHNFRTVHFVFKSSEVARKWTKQLFEYGHNQLLRNLSSLNCLEKIHSKLIHETLDRENNIIPIKSLIQFLSDNRDSVKENICQALEACKLPHNAESNIHPSQFTFDVFFRLYMILMNRKEVDTLFQLLNERKQDHLSCEDLKRFITKQHYGSNDHDKMEAEKNAAKALIQKYAQSSENFTQEGMTKESFLRYLLSFDNSIVDPVKYDLFMDMNKPLSHYFISSSHNTYLTGSQWTGRASDEMYRQVLLTGCRCIELDVVDSDSRGDTPEIKHIYTPVKPVPFVDVVAVIRDYAFKVTSYPLVLSIENHCGPRAQATMAKIFVDLLGDSLLTEPLSTHPCDVNSPLPSPNALRNKILIKNKKLPSQQAKPKANTPDLSKRSIITSSSSDPNRNQNTISSTPALSPFLRTSSAESLLDIATVHSNPRFSRILDDYNLSDDDIRMNRNGLVENLTSKPENPPETKATKEMSDLVIYTIPVTFKTFIRARHVNRSCEMSSLSEDHASSVMRDHARDFLEYNQRQLSRIYPRGTRWNSYNFNPYLFWPIGCQMVALNYQILDPPMQINLGLFSFNRACGYIEKPAALCEPQSLFDPRVAKDIENIVSYDINIKVISGQFLCQNCEPTNVDIQLYGMYGNLTKQYDCRIRAKQWNGFQAVYSDPENLKSSKFSARFSQIILQEMAGIRFSVTSADNVLVGQYFLPVCHLRSGYRHIVLRNEMNIPVRAASLFVYVQRKIHAKGKDKNFMKPSNNLQPIKNDNLNNTLVNRKPEDTNFENCSSSNLSGSELLSRSEETIEWYHHHVIHGSSFNEKRNFEIRSFNDIKRGEYDQLGNDIHNKCRAVFDKYQQDGDLPQERLMKLYKEILRAKEKATCELIDKNETCDVQRAKQKQDFCRCRTITCISLKLNKMYEEAKQTLEESYQKNLDQLEEKRSSEKRGYIEQFEQELDNSRRRLNYQLNQNGYGPVSCNDNPMSTMRHARIFAASASTDEPFALENGDVFDPQPRRQTMDS